MKTITLALLLAALALIASSTAVPGQEVTVQFDDADRAPADSFTIGGITVDGYSTAFEHGCVCPSQVATAQGIGLGVAGGLGADGEVNNLLHEFNGKSFFAWQEFEEVELWAPLGHYITSITVKLHFGKMAGSKIALRPHSHFQIDGSSGAAATGDFLFDIYAAGNCAANGYDYGNGYCKINLSPFILYLFEFGAPPPYKYSGQHWSKEKVFQWGFSVVSLTYAPTPN